MQTACGLVIHFRPGTHETILPAMSLGFFGGGVHTAISLPTSHQQLWAWLTSYDVGNSGGRGLFEVVTWKYNRAVPDFWRHVACDRSHQ